MNRGDIICFLLLSSVANIDATVLQVAEVALTAYDVISAGIDFIGKIVSGDPLDNIQESLDQLKKSIDRIHTKLDYLTDVVNRLLQLVKELPYTLLITQHVEKIKSCTTDMNNFLARPTNTAARETLQKCYDIRVNVRAIAGYLSGEPIPGSPPLFDLYKQKQGTYDGETIKNMFTYLYTYFIDGCAVVITAEGLKYHMSSSTIRNECKAKVGAIQNYMKNFYSKCIREMCPHFTAKATTLLSKVSKASSAHTTMTDAFPWFQFLVIKISSVTPNISDTGTFKMKSYTFTASQTTLFWTDTFVKLQRVGTGKTWKIIVQRSQLTGSEYGTLNITTQVQDSTISFTAYTNDESIDHCNYVTGINSASSFEGNKMKCLIILIFTFFFL